MLKLIRHIIICVAAIFIVFKEIYDNSKSSDDFVKSIVSKDYNDMSDNERLFYTLTLLVGEIEKQALENDAFIEKELVFQFHQQDICRAPAKTSSKK